MNSSEVAKVRAMMSDTVDKTKLYVNLDQSKAYYKFRPRYSDELFKTIVDYCQETSSKLRLAVDVGCGPGMSTLGFCKYFEKVVGVDISETQIACAPRDVLNCDFKVGVSHQLPFLKAESVDLFCSGESFHLMPHKETFEEADRVLKPGGTIALFGYNFKASHPEIQTFCDKSMSKLIPYYPKESALLLNNLRDITLPYSDHQRREDLKSVERMTVEDYVGFVRSLSVFWRYSKDHPDVDLAGDLEREMKEIVGKVNTSEDKTFEAVWELFILMGHKPRDLNAACCATLELSPTSMSPIAVNDDWMLNLQ